MTRTFHASSASHHRAILLNLAFQLDFVQSKSIRNQLNSIVDQRFYQLLFDYIRVDLLMHTFDSDGLTTAFISTISKGDLLLLLAESKLSGNRQSIYTSSKYMMR